MAQPFVKSGSSISQVWVETFFDFMDGGIAPRHPTVAVIDINRNTVVEDLRVRALIDRELESHGESKSTTVASTIFPNSMWNPSQPATTLYERYNRAWPGISKCQANRNGVYFRRLTNYVPEGSDVDPVNQLEFIIDTYAGGNHRKSALQASIIDPTRDHTNNRQKGFPCLQQISFTPIGKDGLSVTGFYATQHLFEKAYGNYLGLYWLGQFMASQMHLQLRQVVCIASVLAFGGSSKGDLQRLEKDLKALS